MIVYYTQFSGFETRVKKPCTPILMGTGSYVYDAADTAKAWPSTTKADYYSTTPGFLTDFDGLFVLDIEHLDMTKPESIDHVKFAIQMYRDRNPPELLIGLYSLLPERSFWPSVLWKTDPAWKVKREEWKVRNAAMRKGFRALSTCVDFVMPSIYQPNKGWVTKWAEYASDQLVEAMQYGLPVIPALWAWFEGDPVQTYIGDHWVRAMHRFCANHWTGCEGVFWWQEPPASNRIEPPSFYDALQGVMV